MWRNDRLLATYKDARAHLSAYLDDYAFLIAAVIELLQARFSSDELQFACRLADVLLEQFEDADAGGFFFTATDHERLFHRPKPGHDNAMPSGNAVAAWGLHRLTALVGEQRYARAAERTLELFFPALRERPAGFAAMAIALEEAVKPANVLVLRGEPGPLLHWQATMGREYLPDTTVLAIPDGLTNVPALIDKPQGAQPVNGWLCRGVTCLPPIGDLVDLIRTCKETS
jgi:uncharacterized protein YyaL (SSP411 family)